MGLANGDNSSANGSAGSRWLYLPHFLVRFVGLAVGLLLILVSLKLDIYKDLPWWTVFLPIAVSLCILFVLLTIAIFVWVHVAFLFFTGNIEVETECEFRLDVLFRTAKICFLGHGYVVLLMLSFGLLLLKLQVWPSLPVVYPLLPLIVLGMAYVFLAVIFKQPEVDSPSFFLAGVTLVSQSIMLVIKFDHMWESESLPWAVTFTPSWLTYLLLLIYCVVSPLQTFREAQADEDTHSASSAEAPYGSAEGPQPTPAGKLHTQLLKVAGIFCWVLGWGLSQALLTLRLDAFYKVSWLSVILPALLGWILLLVFVTGPVSEYFSSIYELLMSTFSYGLLGDCVKGHVEEQDPLIAYPRYDTTPRNLAR